MADGNEVSSGRVVSQWEWITFNMFSGIKIELSVRWILWAKSLQNTWDSVSILLQKEIDEHFILENIQKFYTEKAKVCLRVSTKES